MTFLIKQGYFLPRVYGILICIMMEFMHYEHINCISIPSEDASLKLEEAKGAGANISVSRTLLKKIETWL